jgi:hypothetical protein
MPEKKKITPNIAKTKMLFTCFAPSPPPMKLMAAIMRPAIPNMDRIMPNIRFSIYLVFN